MDLEALTTSPDYVRGTVLAFGDCPELCTDPVPIAFTDPAFPFADTVAVNLPNDCQFATLVLTHTAPTALEGARVTWRAGSESADRRAVIAGQGYESGAIDELTTALATAGYDVTTSATIPTNLDGVNQLWWYDYRPFPEADVDRLVQYVIEGGGLYLTGERPCCENLNQRVSTVGQRPCGRRPDPSRCAGRPVL